MQTFEVTFGGVTLFTAICKLKQFGITGNDVIGGLFVSINKHNDRNKILRLLLSEAGILDKWYKNSRNKRDSFTQETLYSNPQIICTRHTRLKIPIVSLCFSLCPRSIFEYPYKSTDILMIETKEFETVLSEMRC